MKNLKLLLFIIFFFIISILSIYSSTFLLSNNYKYIHIKQLIWYLIGFLIIFILYKCKKNFFYKYDKVLYIFGNIMLLLVLLFGDKSNGAKAWFYIPKIGSIQPSEFMKVFLIIILASVLNKYNLKRKEYKKHLFKYEISIIIKCLILTLIPSILTFLEPDTGNVIIYFIILITMLFIYGIRYRWFIVSILILSIFIIGFFYLYQNQKDIFINIFGTNFFYRMDRIINWKNNEGMQLRNALASTGSAPINGYGLTKTPIYFPESQTDFITSIIFSNYGFIFNILFIIICFTFDFLLISNTIKYKNINRYLLSGITSIIIFQQLQNIGMNIGLLPITGVTFPFISYGGSSIISYMLLIGLVFNINKKEEK